MDEAEVTIMKDDNGNYLDLYENALTKNNISNLTDEQMNSLFKTLRLRISLNPSCNLNCFFCSNEGSCYSSKKDHAPDLENIIRLCEMLIKSTPLEKIDFSGGEPLLHPDFFKKEYKLIEWSKKYPQIRFSLHTNGINLTPEIIDLIKDNFARIGISLHSVNFETWNKITNSNKKISEKIQKEKFEKILHNLEYLSKQNISGKVFLKAVIVRGFNDSKEELKSFLEFCKKLNFHPKFLQFEPQYPSQKNLLVGRKELFEKLQDIGVEFDNNVPFHNDPKTYLPGINFKFRSAPMGLHSIFGCGEFAACKSCYNFLCMFVKFSEDGSKIFLKPCSNLDTKIDLTHAIKTGDTEQLLKLFKLSREYLMLAPGLGSCGGNKEEEYKDGF